MKTKQIIENLLKESSNYVSSGDPISFNDILQQSASGEYSVVRRAKRGPNGQNTQVKPHESFRPNLAYAITDGTNYLWLNFRRDGLLSSGDCFGANDVENLLDAVGLDVSEHDDDYWNIVDAGEAPSETIP